MAILAVLGNKLHAHNRLPHIVKARLRKCLELYRPGDRVIVCGGNVCGARCTCRRTCRKWTECGAGVWSQPHARGAQWSAHGYGGAAARAAEA